MTGVAHNTVRRRMMAMMLALVSLSATAQSSTVQNPPTPPGTIGQSLVIDQVIAIVNGDLVMESDLDEERRMLAFQPFRAAAAVTREQLVDRLVDRTLILQQERLQPQPPVADDEIKQQFTILRRAIPACKQYQCQTDAGWARFIQDQGFTIPELTERWRERMSVLRFTEQRFRMGVRITPEEIKDYYDRTLMPQYARRNVTAPSLDTISDRIQEILLQQRVSGLLDDWLGSLKAQGTVRIMRPITEATP
ncbi:MAG TPA: peptidylprolyl isomerase [Granulicella sp.]